MKWYMYVCNRMAYKVFFKGENKVEYLWQVDLKFLPLKFAL